MATKGIRRKTLDTLFSHYIRARSDWTCERCGKQYERKSQGLHASHFFSRRHHGTRFDERNAFAHCFSCHQHLGGNPLLFTEWARKQLGDEVIEDLRIAALQPAKLTAKDKKEIATELREKLRRIGEEPTV